MEIHFRIYGNTFLIIQKHLSGYMGICFQLYGNAFPGTWIYVSNYIEIHFRIYGNTFLTIRKYVSRYSYPFPTIQKYLSGYKEICFQQYGNTFPGISIYVSNNMEIPFRIHCTIVPTTSHSSANYIALQ